MKEITLNVSKVLVYNEVKKRASYQASKLIDKDPTVYDRMLPTDSSRELLEGYWQAAENALIGGFRGYVKQYPPLAVGRAVELGENFVVKLSVSTRFDDGAIPAIEAGVHSFFTTSILSSWYHLCYPEGSGAMNEEALAHLSAMLKKLHYKRPPVAPTRS